MIESRSEKAYRSGQDSLRHYLFNKSCGAVDSFILSRSRSGAYEVDRARGSGFSLGQLWVAIPNVVDDGESLDGIE